MLFVPLLRLLLLVLLLLLLVPMLLLLLLRVRFRFPLSFLLLLLRLRLRLRLPSLLLLNGFPDYCHGYHRYYDCYHSQYYNFGYYATHDSGPDSSYVFGWQ